MATLQDDIGNGIATVLAATPFTSYIDAANYGYTFDTLKPKRALVRPQQAVPATEFVYDDSSRVAFSFDLYFELYNRAQPEIEVAGIQDSLRKKFGDGGVVLYSDITVTNADLKGGGVICELGVAALTVAGGISPHLDTVDPDAPVMHVPLTVHAWQSYS